jgi:lipopolysaccharide export system permease protein
MFPSRTLSIYVGKMFLIRVLAFLIGLVVILQTLDLLNESDNILAAPGATDAALWAYVKLRAPQLLAQFAPFAVLLGALITMTTLAQNSEVVIMKAAGLSPHQILMPMFAVALLFAAAHFAFNESILVRANDRLAAWQDVEYGARPPKAEDTPSSVWVTDGNAVLHAEDAIRRGAGLELRGFTLFERDAKQNLVAITTAQQAILADGRWELINGRRTVLANNQMTKFDRQAWNTSVPAERFLATAVRPDRVTYGELRTAIRELNAGGHPTEALRASLMHKIVSPMSSVLMPLLGAVAAFGLARSGKLFIRVVIGLALGFAYFVADNFMMAMGQFGAAPPMLAAWAPFLLFFCVGEAVLFRSEE